MSNATAPAPSITVADLDTAKQVATDCIARAVFVRITLHGTDYPLPALLPDQPPPEVHQTIAMLLQELNQAIAGEPHIAKVEPYFTQLGGIGLNGLGMEANWHRLALRFAMFARGAIINGIDEAATKQMRQSTGELHAARERIWESDPKTLDLKICDLPVPKELTARVKADVKRWERLIIREPGQPLRTPQTADEIAEVVVPRTWRVIRNAIESLSKIHLGALSAGVQTEYHCAWRWAMTAAPKGGHENNGRLRISTDADTQTVCLDGRTIPVPELIPFKLLAALVDAHNEKRTPITRLDLFRDIGRNDKDGRVTEHFAALPGGLAKLIHSAKKPGGGYSIRLTCRSKK